MEGCEKEEEEMQADAWQHDYLMAKGLSCSNSAMCRPWSTYVCTMYACCTRLPGYVISAISRTRNAVLFFWRERSHRLDRRRKYLMRCWYIRPLRTIREIMQLADIWASVPWPNGHSPSCWLGLMNHRRLTIQGGSSRNQIRKERSIRNNLTPLTR